MGCFKSKSKFGLKVIENYETELSYPRMISIQIKKKGSRGRVQSVETVTINYTEPLLCISEDISVNFLTWGSACVLPGIDPHEKIFKICQDLCFFSSDGHSIILGLFDGHGKEGEHLVNICIKEADDFFHQRMADFDEKPLDFLEILLKNLVKTLKFRNVDNKSSGCSCVVSLIHKDTLFTANIGNSRAILGTYRSNLDIDQRHITAMQDQNFLKDLSKRRRSSLTRQPFAYQLTNDHVTSNQEEFIRVLKAGGKLLRPDSKPGETELPYKVYLPHSQLPGIVVTRSIGFTIAESIGVIPKPDTCKHVLTVEDEFVVLVSEGVSIVMNNEDVVNFVAKYRKIANRKAESRQNKNIVNPSNSCVAQLLCEEARYRWLSIVENNDSTIEDISCVILEIDNRVEKRSNTFYRMQIDRIGTGKDLGNPRDIISIPLNKCTTIGENSFSSSSFDSERIRPKASPKNSLYVSLELELKKVMPDTSIRSDLDLKRAVKSLTSKLVSGNFSCKSCQERADLIEKLTNDVQEQKKAALGEMENLKEMKAQVKKYENLLKTKEKNLELQRINLSENNEILEKKNQMIEKNKRILETEKEKIKEERLKLEDEKLWFNKKFKKLDEQFFFVNRELNEREFRESAETPSKDRPDLITKTEEVTQAITEINQKHQLVMDFIEKFREIKGKFEENQKNFETIIKEKILKDEKKEAKNKEKFKKIKNKVKSMEGKVRELIHKNLDLSAIRTEEITEKFITKTPSEIDFEDKDLVIQKYKEKCQKLEESLIQKKFELQEMNGIPGLMSEKVKNFESREKELISMQEEIDKEKLDIGKTAEYLQSIWLELEQKRNELYLEKQILKSEKEANQRFLLRENSDRTSVNSNTELLTLSALPILTKNKESFHFEDDVMTIRVQEKK